MTDADGNIVERYECTPFGKTTIYTGTGPDGLWNTLDDVVAPYSRIYNSNIFNGMHLDNESGLYVSGSRYFDPETGRCLTWHDDTPNYQDDGDVPPGGAAPKKLEPIRNANPYLDGFPGFFTNYWKAWEDFQNWCKTIDNPKVGYSCWFYIDILSLLPLTHPWQAAGAKKYVKFIYGNGLDRNGDGEIDGIDVDGDGKSDINYDPYKSFMQINSRETVYEAFYKCLWSTYCKEMKYLTDNRWAHAHISKQLDSINKYKNIEEPWRWIPRLDYAHHENIPHVHTQGVGGRVARWVHFPVEYINDLLINYPDVEVRQRDFDQKMTEEILHWNIWSGGEVTPHTSEFMDATFAVINVPLYKIGQKLAWK